MKRTIVVSLLAALAAAVAVSPAHAASFKRCGNAGTMYGGQLRITSVQAKWTTCKKAKRFARTFTKKSGDETGFTCSEDFYCMWRGWHCRNDSRDPDKLRHRCETIDTKTHRIKVVKWVDRAA